MPIFSTRSQQNLQTCQSDLIILFEEVIKTYDCTILEGYRGKELQDECVRSCRSAQNYPKSKHNHMEEGKPSSLGINVIPSPIDWNNTKRFHHFAGFVLATYDNLVQQGRCGPGWRLLWGGNWEGRAEKQHNKFNDLVHFELEARL